MASPLIRFYKSLFWDIEGQQLMDNDDNNNNEIQNEEEEKNKEEEKKEDEKEEDEVTFDLTHPITTFPAGITFMQIIQHVRLLGGILKYHRDKELQSSNNAHQTNL